MSTEENKALVRRFYAEWEKKNISGMIEMLFPEGVDHSLPPGFPPGIEGVTQLFLMYLTAFPDMHFEIEDLIAEGDKVAIRLTSTGTNTGEFMGMPATGKAINITEMHILRIEDGKLAEHWSNADSLGMMQQLGVIPLPGQAPA